MEFPKIDYRTSEDVLEEILRRVPHYTKEWEPSEKDPGFALIKIFSQIFEAVIQRLNRVPLKYFTAFLDTLGINLLPAQPATAPVTFFLAEGTSEHVLIPTLTQIAAEDVVFESCKNILATPSRLAKAYSVDVKEDGIYESLSNVITGEPAEPFQAQLLYDVEKKDKQIFLSSTEGLKESDVLIIGSRANKEYGIISEISDNRVKLLHELECDHPKYKRLKGDMQENENTVPTPVEKLTCFELFNGKNIQEHILYLGHDDFFNIKGKAAITIGVPSSQNWMKLKDPSLVIWEYYGEAIIIRATKKIKEIGWHPFDVVSVENPNFQGFRLQKTQTGEIKEHEVNKAESRWIRCRATDILKTKDIELDTIRVTEARGMQKFLEFESLPPKAIRGVGEEFSERLSECGINTIEQLINYKDKVEKLAEILREKNAPNKKKKSLKYYKEQAENILENAQKRILDKEFEDSPGGNIIFQGIFPEAVYYNDVPLDPGTPEEPKAFHPFGRRPRLQDTFYIASQECFSKRNTKIMINFYLERCEVVETDKGGISLSWEYWNGKGWNLLQDIRDNTENFTKSDKSLEFTCPEDIEPTEIGGLESLWIRVRIVAGNYGMEKFIKDNNGSFVPTTKEIHPPVIKKLIITYILKPQRLQQCLTYNNLEFKDVTEESQKPQKHFRPFLRADEEYATLYLGFDKKIEKGPISIFFSLEEQELLRQSIVKVEWYYYSQDKEWVRLEVSDNTQSLTRTGTIEFFFPLDFVKTSKFAHNLYWIKAVYKEGTSQAPPRVKGIHLNTTLAVQTESIEDEILGSSDLSANQVFRFRRIPVVSEELWVNEISSLAEEEKKRIIKENGKDSIQEVKDESDETIEAWVRWQAVEDFFESSSKSRHYEIDRAKGEVKFGDGIHGMIPHFGRDNVKAAYRVGGGKKGNVGAHEITDLKTSIPFVDSVSNPEPAVGGADIEQLEGVFERGPHVIKHRDRAVTEEDFERLAKSASSYIARTKCVVEGSKLKIIVIPEGKEDKPTPELWLLKRVERHLHERSLNLISPLTIEVQKPEYIDIRVDVHIVPESMENAVPLEEKILKRLKEFLHPLTGGPDKIGWEFGRDIHISDVYALLEGIKGVDYVQNLLLNDLKKDLTVEEHQAVCSGKHTIIMKFGG